MITYIPGDPKSSPYEPVMGDLVIYRQPKHGRAGQQEYPAVVVKVYDDDRADLTVFTHYGLQHVMRVPYDETADAENVWFWMQPKEDRRRNITTKAEPLVKQESV